MRKRRLALQREPNLVTESKKYVKSTISEEKRVTFEDLFCEVFVEFLSRIRQESLRKTFICFKLLLSLDYMVFHLFPHWPNTTMSMKSTTIDLLSEIGRLTVLFWSSVQIYTHNESLPCVIHVKITFHVWNLIRFLKLKIIYNYSKGTRV